MSLHNEYYSLRRRVWDEFEKLVRIGCNYHGEFPIVKGEIRIRNKADANTDEIIIRGIVADKSYSLHEGVDLIIGTGKVKVKIHNILTNETKIIEVEPDILNIECLSTYLSGGFSIYK